MNIIRKIIISFSLVIFIFLIYCTTFFAQAKDYNLNSKILIVNSDSDDSLLLREVKQLINLRLQQEVDTFSLNVYNVSLDNKKETSLVTTLKNNYSLESYQLVISLGNSSMEFLNSHYYALFNNTPIIYADITDQTNKIKIENYINSTIIYSANPYFKLLDSAKKLIPFYEYINLIYDNTPRSLGLYKEIYKANIDNQLDVNYINMSNYDLDGFKSEISHFKQNDINIVISAKMDKLGILYTPKKVNELFYLESKFKPFFTINKENIDKSFVGGYCIDENSVANNIVGVYQDLLKGLNIYEINSSDVETGNYYFSQKLLDKYNIDQKNLPTNTIIIKGSPSFNSFLLAFSFSTIMGLLILIILWIVAIKNNKYLKKVRSNKTYLKLVSNNDSFVEENHLFDFEYQKRKEGKTAFIVCRIIIKNYDKIFAGFSKKYLFEVMEYLKNNLKKYIASRIYVLSINELAFFCDKNQFNSNALSGLLQVFDKEVVIANTDIKLDLLLSKFEYHPYNSVINEIEQSRDLLLNNFMKYPSSHKAENKIDTLYLVLQSKIKIEIINALYQDDFYMLFEPEYDRFNNVHRVRTNLKIKNSCFRPNDYVLVGKNSLLIVELEKNAILNAINFLVTLKKRNYKLIQVSLKLSINTISNKKILRTLIEELDKNNIEHKFFSVEIYDLGSQLENIDLKYMFKFLEFYQISYSASNLWGNINLVTIISEGHFDTIYLSYENFNSYSKSKIETIDYLIDYLHSLHINISIDNVKYDFELNRIKYLHIDYISGELKSKKLKLNEFITNILK